MWLAMLTHTIQCRTDGTCDDGLTCSAGQCDPTSAFTVSCAQEGGIGCPCDDEVPCKPTLACSSLVFH